MRVGLNLFEFVPPWARGAGVLRYVKGLLEGLAAVNEPIEYILFLSHVAADEFPLPAPNFHKVVVPLDGSKRWLRIVWEQLLLPIYAWKYELDVVHCPSDSASVLLLNRTVVTSQATNLPYYEEKFPQFARGLKQRYVLYMQRSVLPAARAIITCSEHSRREIIKYLRVSPEKIRLTYYAPDNGLTHSGVLSRPFEFPYILDVSSSVVHKNLPGLIRAYRLLRQRLPDAPKLVIVGSIPEKPSWAMHCRRELESCIADCGLTGEVVLLSFVEESRLEALYQHAELFVFPSMYEGFGFVVLEAMKRGIPLVSSDRASLPEVGGDAAVYVNPEDPADIAHGIERVLSDPQLRQRLIERGYRRVESFGNWKRVAEETLAVYEQVAGARKHKVEAAR